MKTPAEFSFKVLDDNCSPTDLTADQTHVHIADKLYALISDPEQQGLTIGLEGEWGSGKSTVVKLLRERLEKEKTNKTFVFYIDAWEHEGDHLRRVFLERLIAQLQEHINIHRCSRRLKVINDKVTTKRSRRYVTHRTNLSCFGKLLAFSTIFVPVGSIIVSKLFSEVTICRTAPFHKMFCIGLAMLLAPLWVYVLELPRLAFCYMISLFKKQPFSHNAWAIFDSRARIDRMKETSLSDERSSVEFSKYFDEIMDVVQSKIESIVMIVDNLDRIEQKDALRIWSTLQTFVQNKNPTSEKKENFRKWIIVPYAQEGLSRIWEEQTSQFYKKDDLTPQGKQKPSGQEATKAHLSPRADSFMDKSFQLRLHVPKMVISGWQEFARACIQQAFPDMNEPDRATILNVLDWTRANVTDVPSPRQIKIYVNEVGLALLMNYHNVTLPAICLYVVKKYLLGLTDAQLEKELREGEITRYSLPQYELTHVLSAEVAAILYGVPEGKAMEILLMPIITSAFEKGLPDLLAELRKIHGNAFDSVLALLFRNIRIDFDISEYAALVQMAFKDISLPPCLTAFHVILSRKDQVLSSMSQLPTDTAIALIKLSKNDQALEEQMVATYASSLPSRMDTPPEEIEQRPLKARIATSTEFLYRYGELCNAIDRKVLIPYKSIARPNLGFFEPFSSDDLLKMVTIVDNIERIDGDIAKTIEPGVPLSPVTEKVLSAFVAGGFMQFDETAKATKAAFEWNNGNQQNQVFSTSHFKLIRALIMVQDHRPVPELLELLKGQCLWNCWRQNQNFDEINAVMITLVETLFPGMHKTELEKAGVNWGNVNELRNTLKADSIDFADLLYSMVRENDGYTWLREEVLANARQNSNIAICKIISLACQAHDVHIFNTSRQYETLMQLAECVGEDKTDELFKLFCSDETRLKELTESEFLLVAQYPQLTLQFLQQISPESPSRKTLEAKCASALKEIKGDAWKKEFEGKPILRPLVVYLVSQGTAPFLDNPFLTAFHNMIVSTIKEQYHWNVTTEELQYCYLALALSFRNTIDYGIAEALFSNNFVIHTPAVREFVLETPNFAEWLRPRLSELQAKAPSLANPNNIQPFSNFLVFVERNKNNITNIHDIGEVIAKPVSDMISSDNNAIRTTGEKAASIFGLISPDSEEKHA